MRWLCLCLYSLCLSSFSDHRAHVRVRATHMHQERNTTVQRNKYAALYVYVAGVQQWSMGCASGAVGQSAPGVPSAQTMY